MRRRVFYNRNRNNNGNNNNNGNKEPENKNPKNPLEQDLEEKIPSIFSLTNEYCTSILEKGAYIGQQGFTILKSEMDLEDLKQIKQQLHIQTLPSFSGPTRGEPISFPVYRENDKKIYIPRFYGESRYGGIPIKKELSLGDDINVPFIKPIRDYQEKIIQVYLDHISEKGEKEKGGGGILEVPCGRGKTVMALKIISIIKKKTLIIVHKEFLMNQWIERIGEFIPTARVGKIQGPKFDIEDKDIVIGMIQSMYDRSFPSNAFISFGLTIIDEVHRIGSEEFSKTLFKTITNCMLGISATVDRKDGLTNVLHMFIGPKIYSEERKDEDVVEVRAIEYANYTDPEYNEVIYDYMGNVAYSTMISKISNYPPRCDFVVRILKDLIQENPEKQIMVLSQIRGLLTSIHEKMGEYDVGFYVGGMKQKDLQETEEKQIVLATYAMAAEALDIKTLNTLVMVSPKTDIIQSVGRILRTRGLGKLIIDIMDTHDVFQNQWKKRRTYYKKCGYGISYVKSKDYIDMQEENNTVWKRISNATVLEEKEIPKCFIDISKIDFDK
jgi:superfamily II DNA or RNA helicase